MKHNRVYLLIALIFALHNKEISAQATIGINMTPDINALLDLKNQSNTDASTKGLLLPRVQLTGTSNFAPLSTHVMGMMVYNTNTTGDVTPGYYYNTGSKWIRLADAADYKNIYTSQGALKENRTVAQSDKRLAFISTATTGTSHFSVDGATFDVDAVNNYVGIGTTAPATKLDIQTGGTTATPIPGFTLADGRQQRGSVLTSDANGIGTWKYNKGLWQAGMYDGSFDNTTLGPISFPNDAYYEIGEGHGIITPSEGKIVLPFTGGYRVYTESQYVGLSPLEGNIFTGVELYDGTTNVKKKGNGNWIAGNSINPSAIASMVFGAKAGDYIICVASKGTFRNCYFFVQLINQ